MPSPNKWKKASTVCSTDLTRHLVRNFIIANKVFVSIKYFAVTAALLLGVVSAGAIDLPVKNIDGKSYYYYNVKSGDTLYSYRNSPASPPTI